MLFYTLVMNGSCTGIMMLPTFHNGKSRQSDSMDAFGMDDLGALREQERYYAKN